MLASFNELQKQLDVELQLTRELQEKLKIEQQLSLNLQQQLDQERQLKIEQTTELQNKIDHEQQLNRELTNELRKAVDERNTIKSTLSKERDILQLRCQELEQRVGILQAAEKTRQESSKKTPNPKTDAGLKKLGLTENILLALPFGYATKVRSAFEKLSYENEKLKEMIGQAEQLAAQEEIEKMSWENKELTRKNELLTREIEMLKGEKEKSSSSLFEVLKNCAALSSLNSLESQRRRNSDPSKQDQDLPYDVLKIRCNLLSQINTSALLNGRLRTNQQETGTSSSPPLNYQHWSQTGFHPDGNGPHFPDEAHFAHVPKC